MYRIVTLLVSLCPVLAPVVSAESWIELRGQALKYMDAGSSAQAESALLASWKLVSADPQNLPAKVVVAEDLAYLYLDRGKTDAALTFCQEAVAASQKAHGPMATRTADLMNSSGVILRNAGKYADAEAMHLKALKLLTDGGHQDSFSMAETHFALGVLYAYSARFSDSEKSFTKAIRLSAPYEKNHPEERARMLDAAARLYTALGRLAEANRSARNAWKIVEGIESPNKNLMIELLDSRGALFFEQRKYAEAERPG